MSKTVKQLTETTTAETVDLLHLVDIANDQDKKIKLANLWNAKPYGESYVKGNTTDTIITGASTYIPVTDGASWVAIQGLLNDFTCDTLTGYLTYVGAENLVVEVHAVVNVAYISASGGVAIGLQVAIDGVVQNNLQATSFGGGNTATPPGYRNIKIHGLLNISNGEEIQLDIANLTDTTDIEIIDFNFFVKAL